MAWLSYAAVAFDEFEPKAGNYKEFTEGTRVQIEEFNWLIAGVAKYSLEVHSVYLRTQLSRARNLCKAASVFSSHASTLVLSAQCKAELKRAKLLDPASTLKQKQMEREKSQ